MKPIEEAKPEGREDGNEDTSRQAVLAAAARGVLQWNGGKPAGLRGVRLRGRPISQTVIEDRFRVLNAR